MGKAGHTEAEKRFAFLVCCSDPSQKEKAGALAARFNVPLTEDPRDAEAAELFLHLDENGLSLVGEGQALRGDFTRMLPRLRQSNLPGELLVRAAKRKDFGPCPTAADATAGLGEDSLLLAAAGFSVTLFEYDPVIAALLSDALARAALVPELADAVSRMKVVEEDSTVALPSLTSPPDIVLLDPMFPERRKSALVKKKFQVLHRLERPCTEEETLLSAAEAAHPYRIIIKRPVKGAYLAGKKPDYSLIGKSVRYDCFVFPDAKK